MVFVNPLGRCRLGVARVWPWFLVMVLVNCREQRPDAPALPPQPPGAHEFVLAVNKDDPAVIARGLVAGIDPNARDRFGETALIWAVLRANRDLVAELLRRGADPNLRGIFAKTAVHWAAQEGEVELLRELIDAGGDIHVTDRMGRTPLMYAAISNGSRVTDLLLQEGAAINGADKEGRTALQQALLADSAQTVEQLILAGADIEGKDGEGETPLSLAMKQNKIALLISDPILAKYPNLKKRLALRGQDVILNDHERPRLDLERVAQRIHRLVNQKRREAGLQPLHYDHELAALAGSHCRDMAEKGFFGSVDPAGRGPLARARAAAIDKPGESLTIAENDYQGRIFSGFSAEIKNGIRYCNYQWHGPESLVSKVVLSWMGRTAYRENILSDRYNRSGVGLAVDRRMRVFIVHNFAHRGEPLKTQVLNQDERPTIDPALLAMRIHQELNRARRRMNLPPLIYDEALETIAAKHSLDMAHNRFLGHVNPAGEDPTARAKKHKLVVRQQVDDYFLERGVGENICRLRLFSGTQETVMEGVRSVRFNWLTAEALAAVALDQWLDEPHGRANLLGTAYDRHGIGIAQDGDDRLYLTQNLFSRKPLEKLELVAILNEGEKPCLDFEVLARRIHALVNAERGKQGLKPLLYDTKLARLATQHSLDMAGRGYFEHRNPEGEDATNRAARQGFETSRRIGYKQYKSGIGENIYRDRLFEGFVLVYREGRPQASPRWYEPETLARRTVAAWMNSADHRENLLTAAYRGHGIGLALDKEDRIFITQNLF